MLQEEVAMNVPSALRTLALVSLVGIQLLGNVPPALAQQSRNLTLVSHVNLHPPADPSSINTFYSGCAPYIHSDGREYVVQLTPDGASIIRLTDPANPVEVGFFPTKYPWSEARQYSHYIYMTTDEDFNYTVRNNNVGLAIIDMANPDNPHKVANLQSPVVDAHSIEIDQTRGLLYANGQFLCTPDFSSCDQGSMLIFSLADPENPTLLATYPDYVHHIHVKGTLGYASLLFEGGGTATDGYCAILDLSDPSHPREISRIVTDWENQHSTWTSEDGRTLYACNENAEKGLTVWDVSNSASPRLLFTDESLPKHVIHQPRVLGTTLYLSHYTAGVRLMDIRNPGWPVEFAYYDTYPGTAFEGFFSGAYDVMPFFPSGIFVVSDMETGLYVFRKNPVNYGIVRGTIRDGSTGTPIGGATVTVQPSGLTVKSGQDGRYAFAVPSGGTSSITVSTYGDVVPTRNVSVALNSDQTVDFTLSALPSGTLQGMVRATNGGAMLPGSEVEILGTPLRAISNAQGAYTFPSVPVGTYDVRTARPGFAAQRSTVTIPRSNTTRLDFSLGPVLFYDDAEADRGWSLSNPADFAVAGFWERSVPGGKTLCSDGSAVEPAADHSPAPGTMCFNTSTFQVACFPSAGAVAGTVTLTSPVLHLGGVVDPRIGYWRWFQTTLPGVPTTAQLITQLSNDGGATWVTADTYQTLESAWRFAEVRVSSFIPNPSDVLLRFIVNNSTFDFMRPEVDIDDIAFYSGNGGTGSPAAAMAVAAAPAFAVGTPRPSPTHGPAEVDLTLSRETPVHVDVYDLRGRLIRTVLEGTLPGGNNLIRWDGRTEQGTPAASGVYWMAIRAGDEKRNVKLVIVR